MSLVLLIADPVVSGALAGCIALILSAAAWHKFSEPLMFEAALDAYRLLPAGRAALLARVLPVLELLLGAALLLPATRPSAALGVALLLALYGAAIAINLLRGRRHIDCGCGAEVHLLSWGLVARNLILILAALTLRWPSATRDYAWLDGVSLAAGVCALYGAYLLFDELLRQQGRIGYLRSSAGARP